MLRFNKALRCIWQTHPGHPGRADLKPTTVANRVVLVCQGCSEVYLTDGEIPIMLEDGLLSTAERKAATAARKIVRRRIATRLVSRRARQ